MKTFHDVQRKRDSTVCALRHRHMFEILPTFFILYLSEFYLNDRIQAKNREISKYATGSPYLQPASVIAAKRPI